MFNIIMDLGERDIVDAELNPELYDAVTSSALLIDTFYYPVLSAATVFCITVIVGGIFRFVLDGFVSIIFWRSVPRGLEKVEVNFFLSISI